MEIIKKFLGFLGSFYKNNKRGVFRVITALILLLLLMKSCLLDIENSRLNETICKNESTNTTIIQSYDKKFKDLKKENRELYDSLKDYKDQIDFLIQFDYTKTSKVDTVYTKSVETVYVENEDGEKVLAEDKEYHYSDELGDTLSYDLTIGSKVEPSWYTMNFKVKDKFTIVNKEYGDANETTITTNGDAKIDGITVYNKQNKKKFWQRFAVGPQIGVGYDVVNNKVGAQVGIGVTYDLFYKKK